MQTFYSHMHKLVAFWGVASFLVACEAPLAKLGRRNWRFPSLARVSVPLRVRAELAVSPSHVCGGAHVTPSVLVRGGDVTPYMFVQGGDVTPSMFARGGGVTPSMFAGGA